MEDSLSTKNTHESHYEPVVAIGDMDVVEDKDVGKHGLLKPKVHFRLWQTLGLNFSLTCTPMAIGSYLALIGGLGGFPYFVWCFVFAGAFQILLGTTIAELASAMPHSSGEHLPLLVASHSSVKQLLMWCFKDLHTGSKC